MTEKISLVTYEMLMKQLLLKKILSDRNQGKAGTQDNRIICFVLLLYLDNTAFLFLSIFADHVFPCKYEKSQKILSTIFLLIPENFTLRKNLKLNIRSFSQV